MTATTYATITRQVQEIVAGSGENDKTRAAYMVARAALLIVSISKGQARAAEMAHIIGDEFAGILPS